MHRAGSATESSIVSEKLMEKKCEQCCESVYFIQGKYTVFKYYFGKIKSPPYKIVLE